MSKERVEAFSDGVFAIILTLLVFGLHVPTVAVHSSLREYAVAMASLIPQGTSMKIRLDIEGTMVTATLVDNATSRDFVSLLPLSLTLTDYAATEKISGLPRRLSTEGVPPGSDPSVGDITYYAPWGNLAVFYRDFGYANGLIKLGTMDSGIEVLSRPGPLKVSIQLLKK